MKKRIFGYAAIVSMVLALTVGFIIGTDDTSLAADEVIKLKYQGKWEGHEKQNWAAEQLKFADRVKAATGGKVIIENSGEVVRDNEVIDGVRRGVIDMGNQAVHARGELGLVNFISLPFVPFDKMPEMYGKLKPTFESFWDKQGVKQMGYNFFLPQGLYTKKPCTTVEELKGMKLRIQGNILVQLFKAAGASPIVMNNAEVYQSGQRGILDGAQSAIAGYFSGAWYEVFKYMSAWPLGAAGMAVIMNKDSWNKLGPTLQGQVMTAWNETEKAQFEGVLKDISVIEKQLVEKGAIRQDPSKAEKDKLVSFAGPILKDWKAKVGPDGEVVMKVVNDELGTKY